MVFNGCLSSEDCNFFSLLRRCSAIGVLVKEGATQFIATLGASSEVIAISIATGVIKTIFTTIMTPIIAKKIKLINPRDAVVFGGLIGTTSGVVAGLAATDEKLVPYGALTATFYTGLGCLLCPSIFYLALTFINSYIL